MQGSPCPSKGGSDMELRMIAMNNNNITLEIRLHHPSLLSQG